MGTDQGWSAQQQACQRCGLIKVRIGFRHGYYDCDPLLLRTFVKCCWVGLLHNLEIDKGFCQVQRE
jgi:hypothetical protein